MYKNCNISWPVTELFRLLSGDISRMQKQLISLTWDRVPQTSK